MEQIVLGCLRLRIVVVAVAAVLVAAGLWQIRQAPLDVVPEFSPETLQVRTEALGLSAAGVERSEEHTSELQSQSNLVCRLLLEKKKHGPRARLVRLRDGTART